MDNYTLGQPASEVYNTLATKGRRAQVIEMARDMAELTIPSVFPPEGYHTGDNLPGNNQSAGAQAVNNLSSKIMFMAFPPGQPIMKLEPVEAKLQKDIDKDPELYGRVRLGLSRLELEHRNRFLTTNLTTAYVGYMKQLLVAGNALWKHVYLDKPTYARMDSYVVQRDNAGHPLLTIHKERVSVTTLDQDVQDMVYATDPDLREVDEWEREVDIYSVCKLVRDKYWRQDAGQHWVYWQEYEGELIAGTDMETDYEDCPMWPGWLIPVYGEDWGRSYCEEYRGDLYSLESHASSINDGVALAAWGLVFVKPGGRTSLRQIQKARNLEVLSGSAEDVTVFRSDKTADLNFVVSNFNTIARRVAAAFLMEHSIQRDGERVTAEEVARLGSALDKAMGGLYTEIAQGNQRRILMRAVKLHEDDNKDLPTLPEGVIRLGVITGMDAMGRSQESQALRGFAKTISELFPQQAHTILNPSDFANRLAAADGIKPDGLVKKPEQIQQEAQAQKQEAMGANLLDKAAGPMAGAMAQGLLNGPPQQPQ